MANIKVLELERSIDTNYQPCVDVSLRFPLEIIGDTLNSPENQEKQKQIVGDAIWKAIMEYRENNFGLYVEGKTNEN